MTFNRNVKDILLMASLSVSLLANAQYIQFTHG